MGLSKSRILRYHVVRRVLAGFFRSLRVLSGLVSGDSCLSGLGIGLSACLGVPRKVAGRLMNRGNCILFSGMGLILGLFYDVCLRGVGKRLVLLL
jgi:hypothetical protein